MVFGGAQHHLCDAAFPHSQEHRRELGSHDGRIQDQGQRREEDAQALDLLAAGPAEHRIHDGDLHGTAAYRFERDIPGRRAREREIRRNRVAQSLELQIRNRREYQHSPTRPPQNYLMPQNRPTMQQKWPKRNDARRSSWLVFLTPYFNQPTEASCPAIRFALALVLVSFALTATAC